MTNASTFFGRLLLGGGLLLGSTGAAAQTLPDTTRLRYEEEVITKPLPDASLRVLREERGVWKLGLNNFVFGVTPANQPGGDYARLGLHLAYERQLGSPDWSVLGEVSPALAAYRPAAGAAVERALSVRTQLAGRYYYNRERRLRLGRRTGTFSANYLSLALGAGLGRRAHETPFYLFADNRGRLVTPDVALLYGLQRRLGRHWFVDANVGFSRLLADVGPQHVVVNTSLRLGLLLGSLPPLPPPVPADADASLRPRLYAGAAAGVFGYRVAYAAQYPYPPNSVKNNAQELEYVTYGDYTGQPSEGYGTYTDYLATSSLPYLYAGYYLTPRLAVQLGVQQETQQRVNYTSFSTPTSFRRVGNGLFERRNLALPVLLRYALTPAFLRRWQFDAVGGLVPMWSSAEFRERQIVNYEVTDQPTFGFRRTDFSVHGSLGLSIAYGFGRRRRVQATFEPVVSTDLRTLFADKEAGRAGFSLGLRYRFGYR